MIFQLEHITVKEFYGLDDEETVAKYFKLESLMKAKDDKFGKFKATPLGELEFGQVGIIKLNLSAPNFDNVLECFQIIYGVKKDEYLSQDIVQYFYALKWIHQEILRIVANEKKVLTPESEDELLKAAGVERLNIFGDFSTCIILGKAFGQDPDTIQKWKYNKVFSILAYDKIQGEVQKRYSELKSKRKKK